MSVNPAVRVDASVLDDLLRLMEVSAVSFDHLVLRGPGWAHLPPREHVSFHYAMVGAGELRVAGYDPMAMFPGRLVVAPANMAISAATTGATGGSDSAMPDPLTQAGLSLGALPEGDPPALRVLTVYVHTHFGVLSDPFDSLFQPVSVLAESPAVNTYQLQRAYNAWAAPFVGARTLISTVLKQLIIELFHHALSTDAAWLGHLRVMRDPQIARAYAAMLARPGASHSVSTLADLAHLSRSAFMSRFTQAFGCSPMSALRQARMQKAASLLAVSGASLDQVARSMGYKSPSSFTRAFQNVLGREPCDVRRSALPEAAEG